MTVRLAFFVLFFSLFITLPNACFSAEIGIDLTSEDITHIRFHSSHHALNSARKIAILYISGLQGGCDSGVFFDAEENKEILSVLLTGFFSKSGMKIYYETTAPVPWGNATYCAITSLDIK